MRGIDTTLEGGAVLDQIAETLGLSARDAGDLSLLFVLYVVAVAFLLLSYVLAGQVWVERHSVRYKAASGQERRMSGFWGEFFLVTACAGVVVVALLFTDVGLIDFALGNLQWLAIVLGGVALIYIFYAIGVVRTAAKEGHDHDYVGRLRNAYIAYSVYTVTFFACGALVVILLGLEFAADRTVFDAQAQTIMQTLRDAQAAAADPVRDAAGRTSASLAYLEDANGGVAIATNLLQDQMNPTFLFAACIFFVNILIVATPIKRAFLSGATTITQVTTALAIGGILLIGLFIYFSSYAVLIEDALAAIEALRPDPALGEWEATQRYNEIVVDLNARKNLLGFAAAMGGEGSGVALFAAAIQFTVDRAAGNKDS